MKVCVTMVICRKDQRGTTVMPHCLLYIGLGDIHTKVKAISSTGVCNTFGKLETDMSVLQRNGQ